jgi:CBS domain-containing protein
MWSIRRPAERTLGPVLFHAECASVCVSNVEGYERETLPMPRHSKHQQSSSDAVALKELAAEKAGALHPQDSVETAGDRMREHAASTWPVAENRRLVGMIDQENPDWQIGGHGHDPKTWQVGQIMSHDVVFCYEDEDCASARQLMEERSLTCLPVVDRQMRIVGIFSREEIQEKTEAVAANAIATQTSKQS